MASLGHSSGVAVEQRGPTFAEFGQRLRGARQFRFPTATELARHLGWSQSRVSKLETGARLPRDEELAAWIEAAGLDREGAEELHAALGMVRIEQAVSVPRDGRGRVGRTDGCAGSYLRRVRADLAADTVVEYAPAILPLIVATPEYTAAVTGPLVGSSPGPGVLRSLQEQRIKHQELLYQHGAEVVLVIEEAALCHPTVAPDVLARQRDRLLALARLPALTIEVRPQGRPGSLAPSPLVVHDDRSAIVGGPLAGQLVEDPAEAAGWAQTMACYRDEAVRGESARACLRHPHRELPAA